MRNIKLIKIGFALLGITLAMTMNACQRQTILEDSTKKNSESQVNNSQTVNINVFHPIIFSFKNNDGQHQELTVLGGSKDGKFYSVKDFIIKCNGNAVSSQYFLENSNLNGSTVDIELLKGSETFKLYGENKFIQTSGVQKPKFLVDGYANEILSTQIQPLKADDNFLIGINGEWNATPRAPVKVEGNLQKVDLDLDGENEIIKISEAAQKDENSLKDGKKVSIIVQKSGKDILIEDILVDNIYTSNYKVLTLDIDGDGKMEIITAQRGHNTSVSVYQLQDNKAVEVLHHYVGD